MWDTKNGLYPIWDTPIFAVHPRTPSSVSYSSRLRNGRFWNRIMKNVKFHKIGEEPIRKSLHHSVPLSKFAESCDHIDFSESMSVFQRSGVSKSKRYTWEALAFITTHPSTPSNVEWTKVVSCVENRKFGNVALDGVRGSTPWKQCFYKNYVRNRGRVKVFCLVLCSQTRRFLKRLCQLFEKMFIFHGRNQ